MLQLMYNHANFRKRGVRDINFGGIESGEIRRA